jgi:hypothetical protein
MTHDQATYAPSGESLRRSLHDVADGLHGQLCELYARPSAEAAEILAANLAVASRAVLRHREALLREGSGGHER